MISKKMFKLAEKKTLIIIIVIFLLFLAFVLPRVSQYTKDNVGESSPDLSFFYSADDLYEMAETYGIEGRRIYVMLRFTFDLVFPILFTLFLTALLARMLDAFPAESRIRNLIFIPIGGALFDYLENIGAAIVVGRFPAESDVIAHITPYFTLLKWLLISISFLLIVILIVYRIIKLINKRKIN